MKNYHIHDMLHGIDDEESHAILNIVYGVIGVWFLASCLGGVSGIFNQPDVPPVTVGLFILLPTCGFIIAYASIPRLQHAVDGIPLWSITIAHIWRFIGLGFVIGAVVNALPPQFGYSAGIGDIATAAICLPLVRALRKPHRSHGLRTMFIAWNVFGLVDLLSAITVGILYSPSSFGVIRTDVSTALMTTFPVNLIPTFFVPLFILLHILALKRSRELA